MNRPIIDFAGHISRNTFNFMGREWVFQAVNDWLADDDSARCFLLTGKPGSGKTAIAARLVQFSQGSISPLQGLPSLTPNFLSAMHFCSARDRRWINPSIFAESLALQLSARYQVFAKALAESRETRGIKIEVAQTVTNLSGGRLAGVVINRLNVSELSPEDAFIHVVREPLEVLLTEEPDRSVVILVDALDEALLYTGKVDIVSLLSQADEMPNAVRFILTSRKVERIEHSFRKTNGIFLSSSKFDARNQSDISGYIEERLLHEKELATQANQLPAEQVQNPVRGITSKAGGNFLYARFLLDAIARGQRPLTALEGLPQGLDELYFDSLERVVKLGKRDWVGEYAPFMGVLSVAQESLTQTQLAALTWQSPSAIWEYLGELQQFLEKVEPKEKKGEKSYLLYHQSVVDFFNCQWIVIEKEDEQEELQNRFYLPAQEWHKKVASRCEQGNIESIWRDEKDDPVEQSRREYARRYYVPHLYAAAEWQRLFDVLDNVDYARSKIQYDPSMQLFTQDLDLGRQAAVREGRTVEEGMALLAPLWRYTLLRSCLKSRADRYPLAAFQLLLLLKQKARVLGMIELLARPAHKALVLLHTAKYFAEQPGRETGALELFTRCQEVAQTITESKDQARILRKLGTALTQAQLWQQAEAVWAEAQAATSTVESEFERVHVLCELGAALTQAQQREQAETIWAEAALTTHTIPYHTILEAEIRALALCELGDALTQAGRWEQARDVLGEAETLAHTSARALCKLGLAWTHAQMKERTAETWTEAEALVRKMGAAYFKARQWGQLVTALAQAGQWERANALLADTDAMWAKVRAAEAGRYGDTGEWEAVDALTGAFAQVQQWDRAAAMVRTISVRTDWSDERPSPKRALVRALFQAQQWERAEGLVWGMQDEEERAAAMSELGLAFAQAQQWERAEAMQTELEAILGTIERGETGGFASQDYLMARAMALRDLAAALTRAEQWNQVAEVIQAIEPGERTDDERISALEDLARALVQAQQWERIEAMAPLILSDYERARVLCALGTALLQAEQWEWAAAVWAELGEHTSLSDSEEDTLQAIASSLVQAGQWERVEMVTRILVAHTFNPRVSMLDELITTLIQAGQWERAEALAPLAHMTTPEKMRAEALCTWGILLLNSRQRLRSADLPEQKERIRAHLKHSLPPGVLLARTQQWERAEALWAEAEAVAYSIEYEPEKVRTLCALAALLNQTPLWERAETWLAEADMFTHMIPSKVERVEALCDLALGFAQADQWERAEAMLAEAEALAPTLQPDHKGLDAVYDLLGLLLRARLWEQAEALARTTKPEDERAVMLFEIGTALAQSQQWERSETLWAEAEAAARTIKPDTEHFKALLTMGRSLVRNHQWERAEALAHCIESQDWQAILLEELATELIKAQQWERAEALARSRELQGRQTRLLHELATALIQARQWQQAESVAHTIKSKEERGRVLRTLANALALARKWEQAETVVHSIESHKWRTKVLSELGTVLAQDQQWARAEVIWTEAEMVALEMAESEEKAEVVSELASALASVPQWNGALEHLLRLVQRSWLQAGTREYAIQLLSPATKLITFVPEVATSFYKAFDWVDSVLYT